MRRFQIRKLPIRKSLLPVAAAAALAFAAAPAAADIDSYVAYLYGANEVGGGGDADGFGIATMAVDNVALTVSWSILALNIDLPLSGAHIHQAPAGVNGGVVVNFGGSLTGSNLFDADLALINPGSAAGFYVNLHNAAFPAGALRGQLEYIGSATPPIPEPGTAAMMFAGVLAVGVMLGRRRRL